MKKIFALLITVFMLFALIGCSKQFGSGDTEWLSNIDHTSVTSISVEKGYQGVAPGTKTDIYITEDEAEIERLVNAWKNVKLTLAIKVEATGGGAFTEIAFNMSNGDKHTIFLNRNYYIEDSNYYELSEIPMIAEDKITYIEQGETQ